MNETFTIYFEFILDNNTYAVLSNKNELNEGDEILLVKEKNNEGEIIFEDISSEEEYNKVYSKYLEVIEKLEDDEND